MARAVTAEVPGAAAGAAGVDAAGELAIVEEQFGRFREDVRAAPPLRSLHGVDRAVRPGEEVGRVGGAEQLLARDASPAALQREIVGRDTATYRVGAPEGLEVNQVEWSIGAFPNLHITGRRIVRYRRGGGARRRRRGNAGLQGFRGGHNRTGGNRGVGPDYRPRISRPEGRLITGIRIARCRHSMLSRLGGAGLPVALLLASVGD